MPPPTPVPRMAAKTVSAPAPAPSVASDTARQSASLATRTGRDRAAATSRSKRRPLRTTLLAFLTSPLVGEIAPGMPMPTGTGGRMPNSCSIAPTSPAIARTVPS